MTNITLTLVFTVQTMSAFTLATYFVMAPQINFMLSFKVELYWDQEETWKGHQ